MSPSSKTNRGYPDTPCNHNSTGSCMYMTRCFLTWYIEKLRIHQSCTLIILCHFLEHASGYLNRGLGHVDARAPNQMLIVGTPLGLELHFFGIELVWVMLKVRATYLMKRKEKRDEKKRKKRGKEKREEKRRKKEEKRERRREEMRRRKKEKRERKFKAVVITF